MSLSIQFDEYIDNFIDFERIVERLDFWIEKSDLE